MTRTYTCRPRRISPRQHAALQALFAHLGWLRNQEVAKYRDDYKEGRKTASYYDLCGWLTTLRGGEDERTRRFGVEAQRSVLKRVWLGYEKFFRDHEGRPRFRPISTGVHSFEVPGATLRKHGKYYVVAVKGIGKLRFADRRSVLDGGSAKVVRIVRTPLGKGYEVQLVVDHGEAEVAPDPRPVIGVDIGVKAIATLSNGAQYAPVRHDDRKRKALQRKVSRARRGSHGRKKKKAALARESRRIATRRKHAVHRITTDIVQRHSAHLAVESLKITNMTAKGGSRKRGLNRAMLSQSLSMVVSHLAYKAESVGGKVVFVDPRNTTQQCSACGGMPPGKLTLAVRVYACVHCGHVQDRDVNAARNIRARGLASLGWPGMQPPCRPVAAQAAHGRPWVLLRQRLRRPATQERVGGAPVPARVPRPHRATRGRSPREGSPFPFLTSPVASFARES